MPFRFARLALGAVTLAIGLGGASTPLHAQDLKFSGFASVVAGRTFGDCQPDNAVASRYHEACTRYIADWSHTGIYTPELSASEESRLGLQWTATFSPTLSATAQVVARLNEGRKVNLEWAYLTWKPSADWTLQVGRKRLPLYYYSDFQDIGYAYTTIRPSPDVYGWDVVNYNGANLAYATELGGWSLRSSLFGGAEDSKDNGYARILYDVPKTVKWSNIRGLDLELNRDWLTLRASVVQAHFQQKDQLSGAIDLQPSGADGGDQTFYGVALIADYENWLGRTEVAVADRSKYAYKGSFYLVSAGYRLGAFTPMLAFSNYSESTPFPDVYAPTKNRTTSAVLRYELSTSSALKLQFDRARDMASVPYAGNAKVLTAAYDLVF